MTDLPPCVGGPSFHNGEEEVPRCLVPSHNWPSANRRSIPLGREYDTLLPPLNDPHNMPAASARSQVFLSYGRRDAQSLAERLRISLLDRFDVWQDSERIRVGWTWDAEVEAGLRASRAVIFLLTPESVRETRTARDGKDSVCRDELSFARDHDIPIVPVRVTPCDTPLLVHRLQQVDFQGWRESASAFQVGAERIAQAVDSVLRGEPVPERSWLGSPVPFNFEPLLRQKLHQFTGRRWLFAEITSWLEERSERALLIVGDPGIGKSSAAAALVRDNPNGQILAYHFADEDTPATIDPGVFVRSLAGLLAARLDGYQPMLADPEIGRVLANAGDDPASAFETAVIGPLGKLPPPEGGARYLLIDALDEAISWRKRPTIVDVLSSRIDRLPPWLRLVATTRPEPAVLDRLKGLRAFSVEVQDRRNLEDLETFIVNRLREPEIRRQIEPSEEALRTVARRLLDASAGNFLVVTTALEAVHLKLFTLAEAEGLSPRLEARYRAFFERLFPDPRVDFKEARRVLETVVAAEEPLLRDELAGATGIDDEYLLGPLLERLSSFVPSRGGRYRVGHKTLSDWLTGDDDGRPKAGPYFTKAAAGHARLSDWCWADHHRRPPPPALYTLRHLPTHLAKARRTGDLQQLLFDFDWLSLKLAATDMLALITDCRLLATEASQRLASVLRAAQSLVGPGAQALAQQILARLPAADLPELQGLRDEAGRSMRSPALRPLFPTMTLTGVLATLERVPSDLTALVLSEDKRILHGWPERGKPAAWDVNSGEALAQPSDVAAPIAAWRPSPSSEEEWGKRIGALAKRDPPNILAASADGSRIAAAWHDGFLGAFDLADPDRVRVTKGHLVAAKLQFIDHDRFVSHATMHTAEGNRGEGKIWDFRALGSLPWTPGHSDWVRGAAIFPDSSRAATVSIDRTLKVWDLGSGRLLHSVEATMNSVGAVAVSPDGRHILTGDRQHCLKLWDPQLTTVKAWIPDSYCINAVAFTRDPRYAVIAAGCLQWVDVEADTYGLSALPTEVFQPGDWDAIGRRGGIRFESDEREFFALAVAPDDSLVLGGAGTLRGEEGGQGIGVWDLATRERRFTLEGHRAGVTAIAVAQHGPELRWVSASADGTAISWDLERRRAEHVLRGHGAVVRTIAITSDGCHAVSGGDDRTLRLWDLNVGQELARFTGDAAFTACAISPDDCRLIAGDMFGQVHFFELLWRT